MAMIPVITCSCGLGAKHQGCASGPDVIVSMPAFHSMMATGKIHHHPIPSCANVSTSALTAIQQSCQTLANTVRDISQQSHPFILLGGDHSCAIGTWSGVKAALPPSETLGLLWVDAHMDCHTFATSPSGMIHGMPLAVLLGHGATELTHIGEQQATLQPEHICLIGVRSYESAEWDLLRDLGVRVYFMTEIRQRGLTPVFNEALSFLQSGVDHFGVSIDIDAFDPKFAPGVGTPADNGLDPSAFASLIGKAYAGESFVGVEICEYNPQLDHQARTATVVWDLLAPLLK